MGLKVLDTDDSRLLSGLTIRPPGGNASQAGQGAFFQHVRDELQLVPVVLFGVAVNGRVGHHGRASDERAAVERLVPWCSSGHEAR